MHHQPDELLLIYAFLPCNGTHRNGDFIFDDLLNFSDELVHFLSGVALLSDPESLSSCLTFSTIFFLMLRKAEICHCDLDSKEN